MYSKQYKIGSQFKLKQNKILMWWVSSVKISQDTDINCFIHNGIESGEMGTQQMIVTFGIGYHIFYDEHYTLIIIQNIN